MLNINEHEEEGEQVKQIGFAKLDAQHVLVRHT